MASLPPPVPLPPCPLLPIPPPLTPLALSGLTRAVPKLHNSKEPSVLSICLIHLLSLKILITEWLGRTEPAVKSYKEGPARLADLEACICKPGQDLTTFRIPGLG